jgi:hypothetical protein
VNSVVLMSHSTRASVISTALPAHSVHFMAIRQMIESFNFDFKWSQFHTCPCKSNKYKKFKSHENSSVDSAVITEDRHTYIS